MSLSPLTTSSGRLSARRRGTLAVASALALGAAAVPALAGCGSASVFACGVRNDDTSALPVSTTTISTVLFPRNDNTGLSFSLYDALVPAGFTPAAEKQVAVQLTRYDIGHCQATGSVPAPAPVTAAPAPPCRDVAQAGTTSWIEGTVAIAVSRGGDTGWLPVSSPFSSASEMADAVATGVPAYAAQGDVAVTARNATGSITTAVASATKGGAPTIGLRFSSNSEQAPSAAFDLAQGAASFFSVTANPAATWRTSRNVRPTAAVLDLTGDVTQTTAYQPGVTSTSSPRRGAVEVSLAPVPLSLPGRTLADLVSLDQVAQGVVRAEDGLLITKRDNLSDATAGPLPVPPAAPGVVVAPAGGATIGFANRSVVVGPGGAVTFVNVDSGQDHTFTAKASGPDGKPLFDSVVKGGETATVGGTDRLAPGAYNFLCTLHEEMRGVLLVG